MVICALVRPQTPLSGSDEDSPNHVNVMEADLQDEEGDGEMVEGEEAAPRRKPGGYNSRIEQILYENPKMQILITDAGKSLESGGRHIVYTIRTGVSRRR